MLLGQHTFVFALVLFVAVLGCMALGHFLRARQPKDAQYKTGSIDGAVYGLAGLLIGFAFYGAAERFQHRRELIIDEVNAIGTAYSRVDLVQPDRQQALRDAFRAYLAARLAVYAAPDDLELVRTRLAQQEERSRALWSLVVASVRAPEAPSTLALVVPVNEMLDVAATRTQIITLHPPGVIFVLLALACLVSGLLVGFSLQSDVRLGLHKIVYAASMAAAFFVIVELEYPRLGFVRVDDGDVALVQLLESMK